MPCGVAVQAMELFADAPRCLCGSSVPAMRYSGMRSEPVSRGIMWAQGRVALGHDWTPPFRFEPSQLVGPSNALNVLGAYNELSEESYARPPPRSSPVHLLPRAGQCAEETFFHLQVTCIKLAVLMLPTGPSPDGHCRAYEHRSQQHCQYCTALGAQSLLQAQVVAQS
jgi:hypothetical protein